MIKTVFALGLSVSLLSTALANEPATKPAEPGERVPDIQEGVIRLPDGQTFNLADLPQGAMTRVAVMRGMGDGTTTQVNDDQGREITINESDEGRIQITIKEEGKDPVEITAANLEELEEKHPEAFEIYQRHSRPRMMFMMADPAGGGAVVHGQQVELRLGGAPGMGMGRHGAPTAIDALGASGMAVHDPFVKAQLGDGVVITKIDPESFAETLGLKRFDLVKSVNGKPVHSPTELDDALIESDQVSVEIIREGKALTLEEK